MIGARPPEYDAQQWQELRREVPAALAVMGGLLSVLAASVAWLLVLIPASHRGSIRLDPVAWIVVLPAAVLVWSGLLSYRPRAIRLLRLGLILAPLAAGAATLAAILHAPIIPDGRFAGTAVLVGLTVLTVLTAGGSATALRASALSDRQRAPGGPPVAVAAAPLAPAALDAPARVAVRLVFLVVACGLLGIGCVAIFAFGLPGLLATWLLLAPGLGWMFRLATRARQSQRELAATLLVVPLALVAITGGCLVWLGAAQSTVPLVATLALFVLSGIAAAAAAFGRRMLTRSASLGRPAHAQ